MCIHKCTGDAWGQVLYGSATGSAEAIAQRIHSDLGERQVAAKLVCLADLGRKPKIDEGTVCIFVCSTTGDGEAPENANKFMRHIKRKDTPKDCMSTIRYTVCGAFERGQQNSCHLLIAGSTHTHCIRASGLLQQLDQ